MNYDDISKNLKNIFYRCECCQYIPLYGLKYKKNKVYLEYLCQNRHYSINKFQKKLDMIFNVCSNKYQVFSDKYNILYCNNLENEYISSNIIDNSCPKHFLNVYGYCKTCYTNFCQDEINNHKKHKIILIENFFINEEKIKEFNNNIEESEMFLQKINKIYFKVINEIKNYLNNLKKIYHNYININIKEIIFCKKKTL